MQTLEELGWWVSQVVIVEKGVYTRTQELPLLEREAFGSMYEGGGLMTTDNGGGSTWKL